MRVKKGISVMQGTALYIGAVLGTGILLIPALTIKMAGPASILSWLILVILSIPLASMFGALGARYPDSGGLSSFARRALGESFGAITGWWFYGGVMMGAPSAAIMGGFYISNLFHRGYSFAIISAFLMLSISILINAVGIQTASWSQVVFATVLSTFMLVTIVVAIPYSQYSNFVPFLPHGWSAVGRASSLIIFSFVGWEAVAPLSQEFRNPKRDIPLSTTFAIIVVAFLYIGISFTTVAVMGETASHSTAPIAHLMAYGLGPSAEIITAIVATVLTVGTTNAFVGGASKLGAALARDGALPISLSKGSEVGAVPLRSLMVVGTCSLSILILSGLTHNGFNIILHSSSACFSAVYLSGAISGMVLLKTSRLWRVVSVLSLSFVGLLLLFNDVYLIAPVILTVIGIWFYRRYGIRR